MSSRTPSSRTAGRSALNKTSSPVRSGRGAASPSARGAAGSSTMRSTARSTSSTARNSGPPGAKGGKGDDKKGGKGKGKGGKKKFKIIEDPKDINKMLFAADHDDLQTIKDLLEMKERDRKVDVKGPTGAEALTRAVEGNQRTAATALLAFGVRPEASDGRAFQSAAAHGNLPLVDLLLAREVENKALDAAEKAKAALKKKKVRRRKKKVAVATPLVNLPSTTTEVTALHHAAMIGNIPVLSLLIKNKANVNAQTHGDNCGVYNGWTPLHFAADSGHLGAVRYLHHHGASLELPTHEGESATVLAAESGRFEVVKWLLAQGCDPRTTRRGLEPAQWALYRGASDAVEYIVGYGGLPELNAKQVWFPPKHTLKDVIVSEFSEALCRKLDTAVYKGEVKYRERLFRRDAIDQLRWIVDVYNPRELDPDKAVATAIEQMPRHIVNLIWLFDSETLPW